MRKLQHIILIATLPILLASCTGKGTTAQREPQPNDTLYTAEAAMKVFAYKPERALTLIDSALIVGNIEED